VPNTRRKIVTQTKTFFMKDITEILCDITGTKIEEDKIKILCHWDYATLQKTITFECELEDQCMSVSLFGFVLRSVYPKEPHCKLNKVFHDKPWWMPVKKKIIGFKTTYSC